MKSFDLPSHSVHFHFCVSYCSRKLITSYYESLLGKYFQHRGLAIWMLVTKVILLTRERAKLRYWLHIFILLLASYLYVVRTEDGSRSQTWSQTWFQDFSVLGDLVEVIYLDQLPLPNGILPHAASLQSAACSTACYK